MTTELDTFYEMVEDIGIAMMTTRRPDGHLESRAMANQKRAAGADLWFVTAEGTGKLRGLDTDPHINLSYYKDRTREWISVSGLATISRDRQKIRELYAPDWKMWFPDEGDARHGTPDDPRLALMMISPSDIVVHCPGQCFVNEIPVATRPNVVKFTLKLASRREGSVAEFSEIWTASDEFCAQVAGRNFSASIFSWLRLGSKALRPATASSH